MNLTSFESEVLAYVGRSDDWWNPMPIDISFPTHEDNKRKTVMNLRRTSPQLLKSLECMLYAAAYVEEMTDEIS